MGGVIADRYDQRRVIILVQVASVVVVGLLAFLTISGRIELWQLMVAAFLVGATQSLENPSRMALYPLLLQNRSQLPNAVTVFSAVWQVSNVGAPAIAGFAIAYASAGQQLSDLRRDLRAHGGGRPPCPGAPCSQGHLNQPAGDDAGRGAVLLEGEDAPGAYRPRVLLRRLCLQLHAAAPHIRRRRSACGRARPGPSGIGHGGWLHLRDIRDALAGAAVPRGQAADVRAHGHERTAHSLCLQHLVRAFAGADGGAGLLWPFPT